MINGYPYSPMAVVTQGSATTGYAEPWWDTLCTSVEPSKAYCVGTALPSAARAHAGAIRPMILFAESNATISPDAMDTRRDPAGNIKGKRYSLGAAALLIISRVRELPS